MVIDIKKRETRVHQPRNPQKPPGYLQLEVIPPLPKGSLRPKRCQGMAYSLWLTAYGILSGADVEAFIVKTHGPLLGGQRKAKTIRDILRKTTTPYQDLSLAVGEPHAFSQALPAHWGPKYGPGVPCR